MLDLAEDYRQSAKILSSKTIPFDASLNLLSILEFEILLKCAVFLATESKKFNHEYVDIWEELPDRTKRELIKSAHDRFSGHVDFSEQDKITLVLKYLKIAFQKGRYSYEFNDHRSNEEARADGEKWILDGARLEDADIRYHPMERAALSYALRRFCSAKIEAAPGT